MWMVQYECPSYITFSNICCHVYNFTSGLWENFVLQKVKDQICASSGQWRWFTVMTGITDLQMRKQLHKYIVYTDSLLYFPQGNILFVNMIFVVNGRFIMF